MYSHIPPFDNEDVDEFVNVIISLDDRLESQTGTVKNVPVYSGGRCKVLRTGPWGEDVSTINALRPVVGGLALSTRAAILMCAYEYLRACTGKGLDYRVAEKLVPYLTVRDAVRWVGPVGLDEQRKVLIYSNNGWNRINEDGELEPAGDVRLLVDSREYSGQD